MNQIQLIECRTGPLPDDERWILRFGSRTAYERARARAAIRHITRACMQVMDRLSFQILFEDQKAWRAYLRALG